MKTRQVSYLRIWRIDDELCKYLGCQVIPRERLPGWKGAAKMKQLFRQNGQCYHKGSRAKALIDALDMQMIIDGEILDLDRVEDILFGYT